MTSTPIDRPSWRRRGPASLRAVLALALTAIGVVAVVPASGAAAASATTITASLSAPTTTVAATSFVDGTVDAPTATPRVVVQRKVDGRWLDRAAGPVDPATGDFHVAITPSERGTYVLRVRSNGGSVVSAELTLQVNPRPTTIIAWVAPTKVRQGTTVTVHGGVIEHDALTRVVVQRKVGAAWSDRQAGAVDPRTGSFAIRITPNQPGTYVLRVRSNGGTKVSNTFTLTSEPGPDRVITYSVMTRGRPDADVEAFARHAATTMADPRGWSLGGSIEYRRVASGGDFTLVLSEAGSVPTFGPPCDSSFSCRSGRYVIINDTRWRTGAPGWGLSLELYHHYVVNHELGHWLGLGHAACPGAGAQAPVMQQQSKATAPCKNTVWPLAGERQAVARSRGVAIR